MIEQQTIEGRKAILTYLKDDFTPAEPADATLVKVVFDDGEIAFLKPVEKLEHKR